MKTMEFKGHDGYNQRPGHPSQQEDEATNVPEKLGILMAMVVAMVDMNVVNMVARVEDDPHEVPLGPRKPWSSMVVVFLLNNKMKPPILMALVDTRVVDMVDAVVGVEGMADGLHKKVPMRSRNHGA
ncbi:hypothetical protein Ancab_004503 [Ancistrocladus abbreviatus]